MKFIIIAELKSTFVVDKPCATFIAYAEDMFYAMQNFILENPEWELLDIN